VSGLVQVCDRRQVLASRLSLEGGGGRSFNRTRGMRELVERKGRSEEEGRVWSAQKAFSTREENV